MSKKKNPEKLSLLKNLCYEYLNENPKKWADWKKQREEEQENRHNRNKSKT